MLYTGAHGLVAHECILDLREITKDTGVTVDDVAKRLIDYGFHAPTMSFPVAGTLMVEPTESEDLGELDRFVDAMIAIKAEIDRVGAGEWPAEDNPLRNAPHTAACADRGVGRTRTRAREAAFPAGVDPAREVLAAGAPHRRRLRRPPPGLRLPAGRRVRLTAEPWLGMIPGRPWQTTRHAERPVRAGRSAMRCARPVASAARRTSTRRCVAEGESVGLSTVYRHLQALADDGLVDVIQTPDGETTYRYCGEAGSGHHHHLVCRACGRAEEIEGPAIEKWAAAVGAAARLHRRRPHRRTLRHLRRLRPRIATLARQPRRRRRVALLTGRCRRSAKK